MTVYVAHDVKAAIEAAIEEDQGATYRMWLGRVIPHMGDAYNAENHPFRSHMGASMIGKECGRAIWYSWNWVTRPKFSGRMLRLFNRGHLEEARFIAQLLTIGVKVWQQDANGKQYRISDAGGHFGGSGDGIAACLPGINADQQVLLEFKTHSEKSFKDLVANGVRESKPEHFFQMQTYMHKMGLCLALYGAVNKNNDETYWEWVVLEPETGEQLIDRAVKLVGFDGVPPRMSESPGAWKCKMCDHRPVCHLGAAPDVNCRTCAYSRPGTDGTGLWYCHQGMTPEPLKDEIKYNGCNHYTKRASL
ncbi:hypothetical protein [Pseudomonas virus PBPA162]|uniref:Exonuclease n=1 Tax=Pseudomonas virus PBPA162 TaxID=2588096 RepID=A0A4Y5TNE4_9CAUD|nr:hypothetical protein PQC32_gp02 [Pseudomonas virus PBPA162]QDB70836.1 hypothetical protein [Pseudomonas virus PBPA162]